MALKKEGLWAIVSGAEKAPEGDRELELRFNGRKDRALATIVLALDPSLLYLIGDDPVDPVAVWKKLSDQFQKKSWVNRDGSYIP